MPRQICLGVSDVIEREKQLVAVGSGDLMPIFPVPGIRLSTVSAGIKTPGRKDLVLMELSPDSEVAAVFTRNAFCAAPVQLCKKHLATARESGLKIRYLITNTGNANAGTGAVGLEDASAVCKSIAKATDVELCQVLPFSTGVIGESLSTGKIINMIPVALGALQENAWLDAAQGILTTDTRPKSASRQIVIGGQTVTVTGIAKGAGMIKPDMATMLAYVITDLCLPFEELQTLLIDAVNQSFNRITVDGDTSTNDSVVLVATGASGVTLTSRAEKKLFYKTINSICVHLAQSIVRDGEGATKFVTVKVDGGRDDGECYKVAYAVAESPLVKTALFASDPNWGRVLAAVGRAGVLNLNVENIRIWFDDVLIVSDGGRATSYMERDGQKVVDREEFSIKIDLARGRYSQTVWTTDLSDEYVRINAEYRT